MGEIFVLDAGLDNFALLHAVLRFVPRRGHLDVPYKRALPGGGYCPRLCPRLCCRRALLKRITHLLTCSTLILTHTRTSSGPFVRVAASTRTFLFLACLHTIFRNIICTAIKSTSFDFYKVC